MAIPVASTTIRVERPSLDDTLDSYDTPPAPTVVATGVRSHFSTPRGSERQAAGSQETITRALHCDPTGLSHIDTVIDETTGLRYSVAWARLVLGPAGDHDAAEVLATQGVSS